MLQKNDYFCKNKDKENSAICSNDIEYLVRSFYSNKYIIGSILICHVTWKSAAYMFSTKVM